MGKSRIHRKIWIFFIFLFFHLKSPFFTKRLEYFTPIVSIAFWDKKKWTILKKIVPLKNPLSWCLRSNYHDFRTLVCQKIPIISKVCNPILLAFQDVEIEDLEPPDPLNPVKYGFFALKVEMLQCEKLKKIEILARFLPLLFLQLLSNYSIVKMIWKV